jgi:hypothetical protein
MLLSGRFRRLNIERMAVERLHFVFTTDEYIIPDRHRKSLGDPSERRRNSLYSLRQEPSGRLCLEHV